MNEAQQQSVFVCVRDTFNVWYMNIVCVCFFCWFRKFILFADCYLYTMFTFVFTISQRCATTSNILHTFFFCIIVVVATFGIPFFSSCCQIAKLFCILDTDCTSKICSNQKKKVKINKTANEHIACFCLHVDLVLCTQLDSIWIVRHQNERSFFLLYLV